MQSNIERANPRSLLTPIKSFEKTVVNPTPSLIDENKTGINQAQPGGTPGAFETLTNDGLPP